jgi:hypothetical protein
MDSSFHHFVSKAIPLVTTNVNGVDVTQPNGNISRRYLALTISVGIINLTVKQIWFGFLTAGYVVSLGRLGKNHPATPHAFVTSFGCVAKMTTLFWDTPETIYHFCKHDVVVYKFSYTANDNGNPRQFDSIINKHQSYQELYCYHLLDHIGMAQNVKATDPNSLRERLSVFKDHHLKTRVLHVVLGVVASIELFVRTLDVLVRFTLHKTTDHPYGRLFNLRLAQLKLALTAQMIYTAWVGAMVNPEIDPYLKQ